MKTILVADDDRLCRDLIRDILEGPEFRVIEACDGAEALALAESGRPDLVLLDLEMPRLDGFAVLAELRRAPQFRGVPVLAVTARAMSQDLERTRQAGFDACITKPISKAVLCAEIARRVGQVSRPVPRQGEAR